MTAGDLLCCLLVDGWLVGLPVAAALVAACRIARGTAPRALSLAAVGGFASTVGLTVTRALGVGIGGGPLPFADPTGAIPGAAAPRGFGLRLDPAAGAALTAVWIAVALVLLARELGGHRSLRRMRRRWQPLADPRVRSLAWPDGVPLLTDREPPGALPDAEPGAPMTVGLLRPAVFLPRWLVCEFSADGLRTIARHELAHARWRDPLATAALRATRLALWPILPLWAIEGISRRESEAAADRCAVVETAAPGSGRHTRATYARSLLEVARRSAAAGVGPRTPLGAPRSARRRGWPRSTRSGHWAT